MEGSAKETARGSVRVFLAEALLLPTGIVTAAFLTRALGPSDYGLFTLAATIVSWVSWSVASLLAQPSIRQIGDAREWRPVANTVLRSHAACGAIAATLFLLCADLIAKLIDAPGLALPLRIFSLELLLFALSQAHGVVLVARGMFDPRALGSAVRWTTRMILMVVLVGAGLSVTGAVLGSVLAVAFELLVYRRYVRPRLFGSERSSGLALWSYGAPLILFAISMRLFNKLDLLSLKAFGGSVADAGFYGAAQNLSIPPTLVAISLTPLLLGTLTRMWRAGEQDGAKRMTADAIRFAIGLSSFAAVAAGSSAEIVDLMFSEAFAPAGPVLARLIFAEVALVVVSVVTAALIVAERRGVVALLGVAILALAVPCHAYAVPRFGSLGAANVTLGISVAGALVALFSLANAWKVAPPFATVLRTAVIAPLAFFAASRWRAEGAAVALELALLSGGVVLGYFVSGELSRRDRGLVSWLFSQVSPFRAGRSR